MKSGYYILLGAAALIAGVGCSTHRGHIDYSTVSTLDTERYMGRWYEIARFDHRFERGLEQCVATYLPLPKGKISVENSGIVARTGKRKSAYGKVHTGLKPGQLRVSFFLFFYSDYKVLALDKKYQWALVGSSTPDYLWILSRTPQLQQSTIDSILTIARERGYDTSKLLWVKQ